MSAGRRSLIAVVAVLLAALGFFAGAGGSAWLARERRAEPWRKMHVEHEGLDGAPTRTRVVFDNPALPVQAVEVVRSPEGYPELGRVVLRDATELTVRYETDDRPSSLEAADGSRATFEYQKTRARVVLFGADRKQIGEKTVTVPVELRSALRLAQSVFIGEARAQAAPAAASSAQAEEQDEQVTVQRHVELRMDIRAVGANVSPGSAQVEASCPPFTCLPVPPDVQMPGQATVRIAVSKSAKRALLPGPANKRALESFAAEAREERGIAEQALPDLSAVVAAVGVAGVACRALKLQLPVCVNDLGQAASGAAIHSVSTHEVETDARTVDKRARELYYVDQARASLDKPLRIEVCVGRDGYTRICTNIDGRPFAEAPMAPLSRAIEMRRGIGGTIVGSFVLLQSDGADCKFSPSPRTNGALRLTFDNERNTVTGSMKADQRGTRADLRCSLGTANMSWAQNYNISVTQSFSREQLEAGGKLPLRLTGTMSGSGNFSFSNCRTSGGSSADCPAGKSDSYSYPVELTGELDLATRTGGGTISVRNAPLNTQGSWRIPAEAAQ